MPPEHRFPPLWSIEELEAFFIVKNGAGQKLAFVYFEEDRPPIGGQGGEIDHKLELSQPFGRQIAWLSTRRRPNQTYHRPVDVARDDRSIDKVDRR